MDKHTFSRSVDALNKLSKCQKQHFGISDALSTSNLDYLEPTLPPYISDVTITIIIIN